MKTMTFKIALTIITAALAAVMVAMNTSATAAIWISLGVLAIIGIWFPHMLLEAITEAITSAKTEDKTENKPVDKPAVVADASTTILPVPPHMQQSAEAVVLSVIKAVVCILPQLPHEYHLVSAREKHIPWKIAGIKNGFLIFYLWLPKSSVEILNLEELRELTAYMSFLLGGMHIHLRDYKQALLMTIALP